MHFEDEISDVRVAPERAAQRSPESWDILDNKSFRALAEHWDELRSDRIMPARSDVRLARKPLLLMRSIIVRRNGPRDARIWYAGIKETANESKEMTGINLFDLIPSQFDTAFADILGAVLDFPCAGVVTANSMMKNGGSVKVRAAGFPLSDPEGEARFVILLAEIKREGVLITTIRSFFDGLKELYIEPIDVGAGAPDADIGYQR